MRSAEPKVVVALGQRPERRAAERFGMALPVTLSSGQRATTHDISAAGLSFKALQPLPVGSHIDLTVEYLLDGHNYPLQCEAIVVRCEPAEHGYVVGARLAAPFLDFA